MNIREKSATGAFANWGTLIISPLRGALPEWKSRRNNPLTTHGGWIMAIHQSTIKKLFREHFKGKNPIRVAAEERKTLGKTIKQRLRGMRYVHTDTRHYFSEEELRQLVCEFFISGQRDSYYYSFSDNFILIVNKYDELTIKHYGDDAPVSDFQEILDFIAACQERVDRQQTLKNRREKVREFKAHAVIAQVKKLAKKEKFDFYTETDTVKLKLYVRLFEKECIELHIPFNKFKETLPDLSSMILSLRELHGKGIKFKIRNIKSYRRSAWITHESL